MKIKKIKEALKPYVDEKLIRVLYDNSEVMILKTAEMRYVCIYKNTPATSVWGLSISEKDLMDAARQPYTMLERYSMDFSCKDHIVIFDEDYYKEMKENKTKNQRKLLKSDSEEALKNIEGDSYDHSQKIENDKHAVPSQKTFQKCIVTDHVDPDMVKEDLHLNQMSLVRTIILWLLIAFCFYQFGKWIPSLEQMLEILCAVCIFKAGTDLILLPKRKKEGSKAKIRIQYHTCLKKFYTGTEAEKKIFILMDNWDVFEVTDIVNHQTLWEGDRVGYVFVDGRMVKDFFYIIITEKESEEEQKGSQC